MGTVDGMDFSAEFIIETLKLTPHPNGCTGWFRQTFQSDHAVTSPCGARNASTAIYFLQKSGQRSQFHRQRSDEVFHFYFGAPLTIYWITEDGELHTQVLGLDLNAGQRPQIVVPRETWLAQRIEAEKGSFTLTGVTVAPGWQLEDMDFRSTEELIKMFPKHAVLIKEFDTPV